MSDVVDAQPPLLLVRLRDLNDRVGLMTRELDPDSRVRSGSGSASRVSSVFHGSGVSQEGHAPRAASAGAPQAGHLRAELTGRF